MAEHTPSRLTARASVCRAATAAAMSETLDITMDELLHAAAGIGAYRWDSLLLETSSLAPANGCIIIEALAGVSAGAWRCAGTDRPHGDGVAPATRPRGAFGSS